MLRPSIFDCAGGEPAFLALATAHHQRCLDDPVLNHPFSHPGNPEHIQRLADYWAEVFGGPTRYSGSLGVTRRCSASTPAREPTRIWGTRFVACFVQAADDAGLPDDADLRAALRAYMGWAVAEVLSISPPGEQAPDGLPVPRWGWNGLE